MSWSGNKLTSMFCCCIVGKKKNWLTSFCCVKNIFVIMLVVLFVTMSCVGYSMITVVRHLLLFVWDKT